jgi:hypothetical protein
MYERSHRASVAIFAVVLAVVIIVAFITTIHDVDTRVAGNEVPPGTIGLSQPHPPLDRSPGAEVR